MESLNWDDKTLYREVADYLLRDSMGMAPPSKSYRKHLALDWLKKQALKYQTYICELPSIRKFADNESPIEIIAKSILDALITQMAPIPATFLTAYIVRLGIGKFCSIKSETEENE